MAIYLLIAALMLLPVSAMAGKTPVGSGNVPTFGDLPLFFEALNTAEKGSFLARGPGYGLLLTPDGCAVLGKGSTDPVIRIRCKGGKRSVLEGVNPLPGRVNYLLGSDPKNWRNQVPTWAKVRQRRVYEGVDLIYYGRANRLEFDFVLAPGTDPGAIRMEIENADRVRSDEEGNLVLTSPQTEFVMGRPLVYQKIDGKQKIIQGHYEIMAHNQIGFRIGPFDPEHDLVIDPVLQYSTFLGGAKGEEGRAVAVDGSGNVYCTGETWSTAFPLVKPFQALYGGDNRDIYVAKYSSSGQTLLYATYIGGSSYDGGYDIAVDSQGNAYVTGWTQSDNFPLKNPLYSKKGGSETQTDGFVAKLNPAGSALVYSTYLGGSHNDLAFGIAVDSGGNAYVTGRTVSDDFPLANAVQSALGGAGDCFITKIDPAGAKLLFSSYLGGSTWDDGNAVAAGVNGMVYVTGGTDSSDFPTKGALQSTQKASSSDCFISAIDTNSYKLVYSTYLGGKGIDLCEDVALGPSGGVHVAGYTTSTDFPVTPSAYDTVCEDCTDIKPQGDYGDAFIAKLNGAGNQLVYATYLGGTDGRDYIWSIAVDSVGNAYVGGEVLSTNYPTTPGGERTCVTGPGCEGCLLPDGFVTKLDPTGSKLLFSAYLGGGLGSDEVMGLAVDASKNVLVTGYTCSGDFPTKSPVQATLGGLCDAFLSKIPDVSPTSLPLPEGVQPSIYDGPPLPLRDTNPLLAKPIGIGSLANNWDMLSLSVSVGQFQAPVDLYLGIAYLGLIQLPGMIYPDIMLVRPDYQLQFLSQGIVPWKTAITEVNENLYGDIPAEFLPPGLYDLYLFVTPAGELGLDFYLWKTSFYLPLIFEPL
jgi:hypothetical protein